MPLTFRSSLFSHPSRVPFRTASITADQVPTKSTTQSLKAGVTQGHNAYPESNVSHSDVHVNTIWINALKYIISP